VRKLVACLAMIGGLVALAAPAAQAAPYQGGNYGLYGMEGFYPTQEPCAGTFRLIHSTTWNGIRLKYFYSDVCGSFARIENAPQNSSALLQRSDDGRPEADGWVAESVDPGINYAYTMIGNNLHGRVSRAVLVVDGHQVAWTSWY